MHWQGENRLFSRDAGVGTVYAVMRNDYCTPLFPGTRQGFTREEAVGLFFALFRP